MQLSSIPAKIAAIFAGSAAPTSVNTIPLTQAGITQPGQASYDVGFPTITMTPAASGGINPYGQDINGLGKVLTAVQQWQSAGGLFPFDATFSATIGGYPKGAILLRADGTGFWLNRVDNNTVNPDTVGTNWVTLAPGWTDGVDTGATNACVVAYTPSVLYLKDGLVLSFKVKASNTSVTTLNVNGLGAQPIVGAGYLSLQGGELVANGICTVVWNATVTGWVLLGCTGGSLPVVAGASSNQAINFGQSFGNGQTWQDVTASRNSGTNYTNSTGRAIFVSAVNSSISGGGLTAVVSGVTVANPLNSTESVRLLCAFVVPNGATYSITLAGGASFTKWAELR